MSRTRVRWKVVRCARCGLQIRPGHNCVVCSIETDPELDGQDLEEDLHGQDLESKQVVVTKYPDLDPVDQDLALDDPLVTAINHLVTAINHLAERTRP